MLTSITGADAATMAAHGLGVGGQPVIRQPAEVSKNTSISSHVYVLLLCFLAL